jgi:hypothetical protein
MLQSTFSTTIKKIKKCFKNVYDLGTLGAWSWRRCWDKSYVGNVAVILGVVWLEQQICMIW